MISYLEYLNAPAKVGCVIIVCFVVMQAIGELLEFKGKVVPELLKIRKFFSRRKAEKEEVRLMLQRVEQKLTDVNAHYSADNITRRDNWMRQVNQYGDSIIAINKALAEVTAELKDNTRLTEEMFVQSSRDLGVIGPLAGFSYIRSGAKNQLKTLSDAKPPVIILLTK